MPRAPRIPVADRDWYTTKEVAGLFAKTPETIRNWIESGKLKADEVNSYFHIPKVEARRLADEMYGSIELPDTPTEVQEMEA